MSAGEDDDWPFDQARNCAVITLRSILFDGEPILYVSHDEDDHGWQFLNGQTLQMANAAVAGLEEMVKRDPSLLGLADMPPGWFATRPSNEAPWQRWRKVAV